MRCDTCDSNEIKVNRIETGLTIEVEYHCTDCKNAWYKELPKRKQKNFKPRQELEEIQTEDLDLDDDL